ncbi:hypothetical protein EGW08_012231 [Elysia chlorotica]|uniref:VTT domain-containing protein n=1 Tax=Elysia chlorotica TaxID=188477 RepID=A0A433TEK9_ELYCH|nr:hypothetical protein EGW08_012231 [Elysia chlorotica]
MKRNHLQENASDVDSETSTDASTSMADFTQLKAKENSQADSKFMQLKDKKTTDSGPDSLNGRTEDNPEASGLKSHVSVKSAIKETGSTRNSLLILLVVFLGSLGVLGVVYSSFPNLDEGEKQYVKVPRDIEDAKNLGRLLSRYKDKYYIEVLMGYLVVYIFLQTFAIPGSIFLSIISGFLYPFFIALPIVCMCSAVGATNCYFLSFLVGRKIVEKYFPERAANWKSHVDRHRQNLFNYILFLRITPFLPNWFINITSPVIDVPVSTFFFGTLFGVAPPSFVFVQAGTTLHKLTSTSEAWSLANVGLLAVFAVVALLPVAFKGRLRSKME